MLEVGAGTGGCTSRVLEKITHPCLEFEAYDYTDLSAGFFEAARAKFRFAEGGISFKRLDICADFEQQGFEKHYYDLVIATDVIHATPEITRSLSNIRKLLKPSGSLALVELSAFTPSMFPFATLPGWWYRGDDNGACVPEEEWQSMLLESGLNGIEMSLRDLPQDHLHTVIWSRPARDLPPPPGSLTVVAGPTAPSTLQGEIAQHFSDTFGTTKITNASLSTFKHVDGPVICIQELHRPVSAMPTEDEFSALKTLVHSTKKIPWVTKSSGEGDNVQRALTDFVRGFDRSLRLEYTGLRFAVLQLDASEPEAWVSRIATIFSHCFIENVGTDSFDMDFRVEQGVVKFSRVVLRPEMQEHVNQLSGHAKTEDRAFLSDDGPLHLTMDRVGSLNGMRFAEPSCAT